MGKPIVLFLVLCAKISSATYLFNLFLSICFFSRGPNKYTRNWEDEQAYSARGQGFRGRGRGRGRGPRNSANLRQHHESTSSTDGAPEEASPETVKVDFKNEDFPALGDSNQRRRGLSRGRPPSRPFSRRNYDERRLQNKKFASRDAGLNKHEFVHRRELASDSSDTSNEQQPHPVSHADASVSRPPRNGLNGGRTFTRSESNGENQKSRTEKSSSEHQLPPRRKPTDTPPSPTAKPQTLRDVAPSAPSKYMHIFQCYSCNLFRCFLSFIWVLKSTKSNL